MMQTRSLLAFAIFVSCFCGPIHAQVERANLYRDSIQHSKDPVKLMLYYAALGESVYLADPDSALYFFETGDSIARSVTSEKRDSTFYSHYGPLLNNTAFISQKRGNIFRAVELYEQCIVVQRASGDTSTISSSYLNLGKLYSDAGEDQLALINYGLAKESNTMGDPIVQAHCQNGIGHIFFLQKKYESALNCYFSARSLFQKSMHLAGESRTNINIGELYFEQKQLELSLEFFRTALNQSIQTEDLQVQAESYYHLGEIALRKDQTDSAKFYGEKSMALSTIIGYPKNLRDAASLLFRIYQRLGDNNKALEMHILYAEMNDSLNNVEKNNAVIKEKLHAEYERKAAESKAEQERKTAIAAEEATQQRLINYFTLGALLLTIALLVVAFRSYRAKKRAHEIISVQKRLVDEKNEHITDSIRYAGHLQKALMPVEGVLENFTKDYFVFLQPKDIVSGDFFWSMATEEYLFVAVCDSTGHGVPGAFVSLLNSSFIKEGVNEKQLISPAAIFDFVRERLITNFHNEESQDGMDGVLVRINRRNISQSVYAAANNAPIIIRQNKIIEFTADKMAVGKSLVADKPFREFPLPLEEGDVLVAYTDGFPDQFGGPNGKKYKYKDFHQLLLTHSTSNGESIRNSLLGEFNSWKGSLEQTDDVLVCGVKF